MLGCFFDTVARQASDYVIQPSTLPLYIQIPIVLLVFIPIAALVMAWLYMITEKYTKRGHKSKNAVTQEGPAELPAFALAGAEVQLSALPPPQLQPSSSAAQLVPPAATTTTTAPEVQLGVGSSAPVIP